MILLKRNGAYNPAKITLLFVMLQKRTGAYDPEKRTGVYDLAKS